ncbi:hypothetical protein [Halobacillus litoralis]|uniref:hypothetical protein n=1 Tax=Halobacillus litoralis TaxID=45668 RepID=UPI0013E8B12A|nr:hypothetical protein [Halobacillus litoralis]
MVYRIVGVDDQHIVIEFRRNDEEVTFESYEEAEEYLQHIKSEGVIPSKYTLEIQT